MTDRKLPLGANKGRMRNNGEMHVMLWVSLRTSEMVVVRVHKVLHDSVGIWQKVAEACELEPGFYD